MTAENKEQGTNRGNDKTRLAAGDKRRPSSRASVSDEAADDELGELSEEARMEKEMPVEIVFLDTDEAETGPNSIDIVIVDADEEVYRDQVAQFTGDEDVIEEFATRQHLINVGSEELLEELNEHTAVSPQLSAGDIDAAWEQANIGGEESVGGTAPTPDQDIVDEIGEAVGLTYEDDEPLHGAEKILERDLHRWELDPASAEEEDELDEDWEDELDEDNW
jgi:hypothetical protein